MGLLGFSFAFAVGIPYPLYNESFFYPKKRVHIAYLQVTKWKGKKKSMAINFGTQENGVGITVDKDRKL